MVFSQGSFEIFPKQVLVNTSHPFCTVLKFLFLKVIGIAVFSSEWWSHQRDSSNSGTLLSFW